MIEIQLKSKKMYDEVKQYANYQSELTWVCSFRDELAEVLKEYGLEFKDKVDDGKPNAIPVLDIQGRNVMKLVGAPAEMLSFVGVISEFDPTIPIRCMHQVSLLIKNNLVTRTDKFNKLYGKLGYRSKINELIAANVKFYGKGKLTDHIEPTLTIQNLKFNECTQKPIIYKQIDMKVLSPLTRKDKFSEFNGIDSSGNPVLLRFYNAPLVLKSIAFKGNEISIATTKVYVDSIGNQVVTDPIILPKNLQFIKDIMFTPPNRSIPVDLYRNAMYEFMYRYEAE